MIDDLSFSQFLDVAWTNMLSKPGGMTNPYEFREVMKAIVGYSDRTVEDVLAERKARKPSGGKGKSSAAPAPAAVPRQSEIDKMKALLAGGKPRPTVTTG